MQTTATRNPDTTWVVTNRKNGMKYPNFTGVHAAVVLTDAADYLRTEARHLSVTRQIDWYD